MKRQKGLTTLLVTTMLLVVSLVFSLSSYKNLFYQIKRTQNEVMARKAHWLAEGGLECGFAKVNEEIDVALITTPNYFNSDCNISGNQVEIDVINLGTYKIKANNKTGDAEKRITKFFNLSGGRAPGIIKSTSNLILEVSGLMYPDPGAKNGTEYECIIANYTNDIEIKGSLTNAGLHYAYPPYKDFHDNPATWPECKSTHKSTVTDNKIIAGKKKPSEFGDDYVYSANLDPFKDIFNVPREDWETVRDKPRTTVIPGSLKCSSAIAGVISKGSDRIWVEGDCDLGSDANLIEDAVKNAGISGVVIVVQDGILAVNGAQTLSALLYHFKSPGSTFTPTEEQWDKMSAAGDLTAKEKSEVGYFQNGAFHPKGGYVMDAMGLTAKIRGSLNFSFSGDVFEEALDDLKVINWQEGSWHDF